MSRILVVLLIFALVTPVVAEQVQNGSFEDSSGGTGYVASISKWTLPSGTSATAQRAGIFFNLSGITPTNGSKFGVFTNNGGTTMTVAQSFTISNERIDFDWIYATNNAPGDATHKDPFTVTLQTSSGTTVYTVSNVDDSNLASGLIGTAPWGGGTTYDTQKWQTYSIDTTSLQGQTVLLTFSVVDSAAGGSVTGIFLDDVTHIPEPSTFLLFGLGFVGMALYGRSRGRRKMKKQ